MVDRNERVYLAIQQLSREIVAVGSVGEKIGFDAETIANKIGIDRANVSRELNKLVNHERVIKFKGRPVYYIEKTAYESLMNRATARTAEADPFDQLIGGTGSLASAVEKAKAAICYPPSGIHTLLIGPTGAGKSTFAEKMYDYAKGMKQIPPEGKFINFNCAEYAENSQLLLSHLFGHVKGAFTGAENESQGLVEQANNGILMLDEIHRLPREGQEMLFQLIDRGEYRKLGESDTTHKVNVLIICATTENINDYLLKTFLRRIPSVIELPSLKDKQLYERVQLVDYFFKRQSRNINVPIKLDKEVLFALLLYECVGNIGQLKSDVQLLCARGFLDYKVNQKELLTITSSNLPDYIYEGLLSYGQKKAEIRNIMGAFPEYYVIQNDEKSSLIEVEGANARDVFGDVLESYRRFEERGLPVEEIVQLINNNIEEYVGRLLQKYNIENNYSSEKEILKIVSLEIYQAVEGALVFAEHKLERKIGKKEKTGLMIHVGALIEKLEKQEYDKDLFSRGRPPSSGFKELQVAKLIRKLLESELNIQIPVNEEAFFAIFLRDPKLQREIKRVGVLVIAHGNSTASSMAEVANTMLNTTHCAAIDMKLSDDPKQVLQKAIEQVKAIDQGCGVLLLVDMGSLTSFPRLIEKRTGIKVKGIDQVTTAIVLEAVRKSSSGDSSLISLHNELHNVHPYLGESVGKTKELLTDERKIILTTCLTGAGAALKLKNFLEKNLDAAVLEQVQIIPIERLQPDSWKEVLEEKAIDLAQVVAIVGATDAAIQAIPIITVQELVTSQGIKQLVSLITENPQLLKESHPETADDQMHQSLKIFFEFLDAKKACEYLEQSFSYICNRVRLNENDFQLKLRYIIHCGCLIERLIKGNPLPYKNAKDLIEKKIRLFQIIDESLIRIKEVYGIQIPDTELAYLIELIGTI